MGKFMDKAAELQRGLKFDEIDSLSKGLDDYDEATARQTTVHTRQDLVMVVSLLDRIAEEARSLKRWVIAFGILFGLYLLSKL